MRNWVYKQLSDEALMKAYARGRASAFECLYLRHRSKLFSFLRRQCQNNALAEELAQDTWLSVIGAAERYTPSAKFTTWLFRIAHHLLIDHWRKHGSNQHVLLDEINELPASTDWAAQDSAFDDLCKNLEHLSAEQMETLLLKVAGFSRTEIAAITHAKPETVKSRLRYATRKLRAVMEA